MNHKLLVKKQNSNMPGHSLTKSSNHASQQELLLHGKKVLSGSLNPPAKFFDYTSYIKSLVLFKFTISKYEMHCIDHEWR